MTWGGGKDSSIYRIISEEFLLLTQYLVQRKSSCINARTRHPRLANQTLFLSGLCPSTVWRGLPLVLFRGGIPGPVWGALPPDRTWTGGTPPPPFEQTNKLTSVQSAGVAPEVNLRITQVRKHAKGIHPGFETQGRRHQKSKTGISGLTKIKPRITH